MAVTVPVLVGPSLFIDLYNDLFEVEDSMAAFKLLQGTYSMSVEAGEKLWDLSREVKSSQGVMNVIMSQQPGDVAAQLSATGERQRFMDLMRQYLVDCGRRSDGVIELADESWMENPAPAFTNIRDYLSSDATDPRERRALLEEERDRLVAEARENLGGYPEQVREQFETLLSVGAAGQQIQEDHNFWIDQCSLHYLRRVFLEAGNRLARHGTIAEADDVFYLVPDEIAEGISNGAKFTIVVANRKTEMERDSQIPASPMIGTDYGPPPDNPVGRAIGRFFGEPPPESDVASGLVRGNPGSAGTVTGTARAIANLRDAERLGHGEILVTATTAPPWTPLFATAGGIVTDTGGPLSHCAIVAREYQLPAVVGTGLATQVIKDGQTIEVNGNLSEVRIIS